MPAPVTDVSPPINHILVDYENVHQIDLAIIGSKAVTFTLLVGPKQTKLDVLLVEKLFAHASAVQLVRLTSSGKNALDFILAYHIGRAVAADPTGHFHIISKDTGYKSLTTYLKSQNIQVNRYDSFTDLPFIARIKIPNPVAAVVEPKKKTEPKPKNQPEILDKDTEQALACLRKATSNRPRNEKALGRYLVAQFANSISPDTALALIEKLKRAGFLAKDEKGKVTYKI